MGLVVEVRRKRNNGLSGVEVEVAAAASSDLYGGLLLEVKWRVFHREVWLLVGAR